MANSLIIFVGLIYLYIGAEMMLKGQSGLGVAYLGYAFSNVGLYMAAKA